MINPPFVNSYYYHIYNRGVEKRNIFMDGWDYSRFMETLDFYRKCPQPQKLSDFRRKAISFKEVRDQQELVKIFVYCLMPNHFHLLAQQLADGGITSFVSNLANSYTRYFNTKHKRVGALFQGAFKAKLIKTDEYLLQVSKYIHRNPRSLLQWKNKTYPYSSYRYYLSSEKHAFCNTDFILSYFSQTNPSLTYRAFVEEDQVIDPNISALLIDEDE
ncbi:transposase [Patescibacteria group bacterium]|nr:transposase [Patescibacteria group bacterium]MCL5010280.1 transposase [Patescibacteria group bacterium]